MKSIWTSKTFWTNALAALVWIGAQPYVADNPKITAGIGTAIAVVNIILRFVTTVPVKL